MSNALNRKFKTWPGWIMLGTSVVILMFVGTQQDSGPATPQERIESISKRLACPTCDGESVFESRSPSSQAIRQEIARQVADGQLVDSQIVQTIDDSYAADLKVVPGATGIDGLIWILPIVAAVVSIAGLFVVFRRWKAQTMQTASDADRILVEQTMHDQKDDRDS